MLPRGMIAMWSGLLILAGNFLAFLSTYLNGSISPASKGDIIAIIVPVTVASLTSTVNYAMKNAEVDLKETPKANHLFTFFALVVPLIFLGILLTGIWNLDGDRSVADFKLMVVATQAMFGGVFALTVEGVFGTSRKKSQKPKTPDGG